MFSAASREKKWEDITTIEKLTDHPDYLEMKYKQVRGKENLLATTERLLGVNQKNKQPKVRK